MGDLNYSAPQNGKLLFFMPNLFAEFNTLLLNLLGQFFIPGFEHTQAVIKIKRNWLDQITEKLLTVCRLFRFDLRLKIQKRETWLATQKELLENHNLQVNCEDIREKARNLKRSHKTAKESWKFMNQMNYIYGGEW